MSQRVEGKVAVVTGGSRGVGRAVAKRLVQEGASVIVTDINAEAGETTAAEIGARFVPQDVANEKDWRQLRELLEGEFGKLHILINNAAMLRSANPVEETLVGWQQMMRVNADSVFLGINTLLPLLAASGGGSIINMSSSSALMGMPHFSAYGAAKAAVRGITMSTAVYCKQAMNGVRCNTVHPDGINTPMIQDVASDLPPADEQSAMRAVPFMCEPEDIANTLLFLASDESRHINGAAICVDNSATIHPPHM
ncbi:SDR family oxidoreductase [Pseudomaricurvus alkylphenolicus]|uniref:SDR family oxidoreductase n=1 Tax=Pseudomaricurvus alkylphenolicus TaxID=1306991 RepID=UPI00141FFDF5|nr:SDR family oxidoreductase [Pseudomaricurvus alkylphenolicus]NIB42920.1 SDR family oxidoreductase [Pseudomaricurvus alkylphenolicus]